MVDPNLVERLIVDLATEGLIEPAKLQIVCDTLWRHRVDGRITLDQYLWVGGGDKIAEQVLLMRLREELASFDQSALELLVRLIPLLVSDRNTKNVLSLDGLTSLIDVDRDALEGLVEKLEHSRLIRLTLREETRFIEFAHDYLVSYADALMRVARTIEPRRRLNAALARHAADQTEYASPDELITIQQHFGDLILSEVELGFLFRSAVSCSIDPTPWFHWTKQGGAAVWSILEELVFAVNDRTSANAIRLLIDLRMDEASALLERDNKQRHDLARVVIKNLAFGEMPSAVHLLSVALRFDSLAPLAQRTLQILADSERHPDIASRARTVLSEFAVWARGDRTRSYVRPTP